MNTDERIDHPLVHALRSRDSGLADQAARLIGQSARFLEYTLSTFPGDPNGAIKDFDEAIRLDPHYIIAFTNRGSAWTAKKDYDKAIKDYDEAIRLDPKNAIAFYNKACCYALQHNTDLAIDNLRQAIALGFTDFKQIERDSDLNSIRDDPRYKKLVGKGDGK